MTPAIAIFWLLGASPGELQVQVEPPTPQLGDLAVVYVQSASWGQKRGRLVAFGYETPLDRVSETQWRGFVAIPTDTSTGTHPFRVLAKNTTHTWDVHIAPREFEQSELKVNRRFTKKMRPALRARIRRESQAIQAVWDKTPSPPMACGEVQRPTATEVTSRFGTRRVFNGTTKSVHYGLDLDGKTGDPVQAAWAGRVVMSAMRFYSGGTLVLDHGSGLYTLYFHLSKRLKKRQATVRAGERIGKVGRTGRVTGPHLHWAVAVRAVYAEGKRKGQARSLYVDPENLLTSTALRGDLAACRKKAI